MRNRRNDELVNQWFARAAEIEASEEVEQAPTPNLALRFSVTLGAVMTLLGGMLLLVAY